ncbi:phage tail protein [Cumulibacter manganitolerans]|uniref:phage tail protein n=1 Tax=Cumulibacter manganitolerans TaxID=1884992 RepID=UPI001297DD6C|nr:phage tail protein [Cumulibacter manganitolerans]
MATGDRVDPYANFTFLVELDGITRAGFADASGFDTTIDVHEYREGGDNTTMRKLPGMAKYSNITLKRGLTDDRELYDWMRSGALGTVERKSGSIVVMDLAGNEKVRWNFVNAWPTKWSAPEFSAKGNDVAIETFGLAHEGIERA